MKCNRNVKSLDLNLRPFKQLWWDANHTLIYQGKIGFTLRRNLPTTHILSKVVYSMNSKQFPRFCVESIDITHLPVYDIETIGHNGYM